MRQAHPLGQVTYGYDALGGKTKRTDSRPGTSETTVYTGDLYSEQLSGPRNGEKRFSLKVGGRELGEVVRRADGSTGIIYYHTDHLGSPLEITGATGEVLHSQRFDPWGVSDRPTALSGNTDVKGTRRGFTGHEHDPRTGLIDMRGRHYDPRVGRFLSPDIMIQNMYWGQSWSAYQYAWNNPLGVVDPTGYDGERKDFANGYYENQTYYFNDDPLNGQRARFPVMVTDSGGKDDAALNFEDVNPAKFVQWQQDYFVDSPAADPFTFSADRAYSPAPAEGLSVPNQGMAASVPNTLLNDWTREFGARDLDSSEEWTAALETLMILNPFGPEEGVAAMLGERLAIRAAGRSAARALPAGIKIPAGNAKAGMEHILRRHAFNTVTTKPASKFAQGMGHIEIRGLVNEATRGSAAWRSEGVSRVLDVNMGRVIGTDLAGNATSGLRVVTDTAGSVITAYPIPIP